MPMTEPPFDAEPAGSWIARHKWRALLIALLALGTIIGVLCCGGIFKAYQTVRESEPYRQAVERVTNNSTVIAQLGEPITASTLPLGELRYDLDQGGGQANISFTVSGPRGSAQVVTQSQFHKDAWLMRKLVVTLPNGQELQLAK